MFRPYFASVKISFMDKQESASAPVRWPNLVRIKGGTDINNRFIFWSLTAVFFAYSAYVWTLGTAAPQSALATDQVKRGQALYQQSNCVACHQFYGLGGYMGPDLTNVVSSKGAAYSRAFLISGTERMPDFGFNEKEMDDLVAFLEFVDTMGTYEAPSYELSWYGTVLALDE
jgi:nitric oxide reductase subunit C